MSFRELKGAPLDIVGEMFAAAAKHCVELCAKDPDLVVVHDCESGMPYCVTKAERQRMIDVWEAVKPKLPPGYETGRFWIFGTGGDLK